MVQLAEATGILGLVGLPSQPEPRHAPTAKPNMDLRSLVEKSGDADLLRGMIGFGAERLEALAARGEAERKLGKVRREIDTIVTAIASGMFPTGMKAKMDGSEAERADLEARLAEIPEPVAIHPGLSGIHARKVADLVAALNDTEAAALLRWLIGKIVLTPDATAANLVRLFIRLASGHPDKDIDALTP
ncbi:hypothetical protein [Cereibacter johrii]|uniref:hypothetical protein n=1 Tax=Cereibacter johrii TaxID=445629 RepID=UPI003CF3D001